jgi:hypothetical protein
MIPHHALVIFEKKLSELFAHIDDRLEEKYGNLYPLHPNRPRRGSTGSKDADGLFDIGVSYSLGLGSAYGKGYLVDIEIVTLENVAVDIREQIELEVVEILKQELPVTFPGQDLQVVRDGNVYKIHGDLNLGELYPDSGDDFRLDFSDGSGHDSGSF